MQKTKDAMPQGLMREVMETYKPHILGKMNFFFRETERKFPLPEKEVNEQNFVKVNLNRFFSREMNRYGRHICDAELLAKEL